MDYTDTSSGEPSRGDRSNASVRYVTVVSVIVRAIIARLVVVGREPGDTGVLLCQVDCLALEVEGGRWLL